jgi:hypothetical protein
MKKKVCILLVASCLFSASLLASPSPWAGFYDRSTLTTWGERVIPGIEQTLREDFLPRIPPESRQALRGVALQFPLEDPQVPFGFYSRWDERHVMLPVASMRLFRDLCVAYAWLSHNGYSTDTVSDYLTMLRSQWPSEGLRAGKHTPLEVLGIPANAMDNPRVELIATATFSSGMMFIMGHELGHISHRHPAYDSVSRAQARINESQADDFALELMKQLGIAPVGAVIFFTAYAHWQLDGMETQETRSKSTHPLNAERINRVGQWMLTNADALSRSAENPAKARAEVDRIAPQFFIISRALASQGANIVLRLRGLTATVDGLKPRRPDDPLIPFRAQAGNPPHPWDGVFTGNWVSANGTVIETAMQLTRTSQGIRGFYVFGAGRVRLQGEADGHNLPFLWTLDSQNRGTGVLVSSADGKELTGSWKRESDGYTASWKLKWRGHPLTADAVTPSKAGRARPDSSPVPGRTAGLGFTSSSADMASPQETSLQKPDNMSAEQWQEFQQLAEEQKRLNEQQKQLSKQLDEMDKQARDAIAHIRSDEAPQASRSASPTVQTTRPAGTADAQSRSGRLVGHWRTTTVGLGSVRDDHIVLRPDGTAERWSVTPESRGGKVSGRWSSDDVSLKVSWSDGGRLAQPFTFHQGQLVFPNLQGRRRFWDRVE